MGQGQAPAHLLSGWIARERIRALGGWQRLTNVCMCASLPAPQVVYMSQLPGEPAPAVGPALAAPSAIRPGGASICGLYPVCPHKPRCRASRCSLTHEPHMPVGVAQMCVV